MCEYICVCVCLCLWFLAMWLKHSVLYGNKAGKLFVKAKESAMDEYGRKGDVCTGYSVNGGIIRKMILHKKINFKYITKIN